MKGIIDFFMITLGFLFMAFIAALLVPVGGIKYLIGGKKWVMIFFGFNGWLILYAAYIQLLVYCISLQNT